MQREDSLPDAHPEPTMKKNLLSGRPHGQITGTQLPLNIFHRVIQFLHCMLSMHQIYLPNSLLQGP